MFEILYNIFICAVILLANRKLYTLVIFIIDLLPLQVNNRNELVRLDKERHDDFVCMLKGFIVNQVSISFFFSLFWMDARFDVFITLSPLISLSCGTKTIFIIWGFRGTRDSVVLEYPFNGVDFILQLKKNCTSSYVNTLTAILPQLQMSILQLRILNN